MRASLAVGAVFAASISGASAQACAAGSAKNILGNWYCSAVDSIAYTNFGFSGTYNEITEMNGGSCKSEPKKFDGPLAPLNDEVCLLFSKNCLRDAPIWNHRMYELTWDVLGLLALPRSSSPQEVRLLHPWNRTRRQA